MPDKLFKILQKHTFLIILMVVITFLISGQRILQGTTKHDNGFEYTTYNNYKIFKAAYFHLIEQRDLYGLFPEDHWDYYKYSPTFALLMAPLAYLPDAAGLFLWNLLNTLILFFALMKFPFQNNKQRLLALGFILIELITALQNAQSNALIAGLIIFAFIFMEKDRGGLASLFIILSVFIKLFGIVAFALYIFYPNKLKSLLYTLGWLILFLILPLIVVTPSHLVFLYKSWVSLLLNDQSVSYGFSVAGWLHSWFHLEISKNIILLFGVIIFCIPLFNTRYYNNKLFRILLLSSVLIWVVIFNHKAESPTFIIAVMGVAFWFFTQKRKPINLILLILVFFLTILSPTDLFADPFHKFTIKYAVKVVPCVLVWFKLIYDMLFFEKEVVPFGQNKEISN